MIKKLYKTRLDCKYCVIFVNGKLLLLAKLHTLCILFCVCFTNFNYVQFGFESKLQAFHLSFFFEISHYFYLFAFFFLSCTYSIF